MAPEPHPQDGSRAVMIVVCVNEARRSSETLRRGVEGSNSRSPHCMMTSTHFCNKCRWQMAVAFAEDAEIDAAAT